jgi:hypothetical protein
MTGIGLDFLARQMDRILTGLGGLRGCLDEVRSIRAATDAIPAIDRQCDRLLVETQALYQDIKAAAEQRERP